MPPLASPFPAQAARTGRLIWQDGGAIDINVAVADMSCVFPTATFHAITCSEIYAEDVVKPCSYQDPHAGFVRV